MGLQSALATALTGLSAAETQIDVIGNNLANSQTVGFKSSDVIFGTQFLQTLSLGASPSDNNGGTNPRQIGLGVQVVEIAANHNQGTIEISSSSSDLAIQGEGFFQVQGNTGETLYTRNGIFKLNSAAELVNATGQRLLGYGIDDSFNIQSSELTPLTIPLGSKTVAKATENVSFEGTLTPEGEVSSAAQVIESLQLGDNEVPRPDSAGVSISSAPQSDISSTTVTVGTTGTLSAGAYEYRVALVDDSGNEAPVSNDISASVAPNGSVTLDNLPIDSTGGNYPTLNIYRTNPGGSDYFLLDSTASSGTSYTDTGAIALSSTELDEENLTGNYTYMITYYNAGDPESRPSELIGPRSVVDGRITLDDFPTPPTPTVGDSFPAYDEIRIYRNLAGDQNNFYLVDTVAPGETYTDSRTDAEISDLTDTSNQLLDMDGPSVNSNTLLTSVLRRDGLTYENIFTEGTLSYTGTKGDRTLGTKELEITETSTVQDLLDFISDASGIQTLQVDSANPIPNSENNIIGQSGELNPGAYIVDGKIQIVSNNGEENAVDIDLASFRLEDDTGAISTPNLAFGAVQDAIGQSAATDFVVYDSLGVPISVRVTATLESRTDEATIYRWYADSPDNSDPGNVDIAVGTGLIQFDGNGNFVTSTNDTISINRLGVPSVTPMQFEMDFSLVSGLATEEASLAATQQDGSEPGVLNSFIVGEDGTVRGVFSNGISRDLGQLQLARFANPEGLEARGLNLYAEGVNTGLPVTGQPGENGIGSVIGGALELSNTDIGTDLVELVLASTQYRGNSRVITTAQQLIDELLNLNR
ncbi:flagellar hook-basal body complex protein [Neorhodopirellula lusitana]|uniref:flagellar hook-basal body complex protein n=1 Tax=Neorhodopirellula lusitana TaxID=445327 RepID=UPI00384AC26E